MSRLLLSLALVGVVSGSTASGATPDVALDFSQCGYRGGATPPDVAVVETLRPGDGDDTAAIQAALDRVGLRKPDSRGFRGAVLLGPGTYRVGEQILLRSSGVVLRGKGATLLATGIERRALIVAHGDGTPEEEPGVAVAADAVAGATMLTLASVDRVSVGSSVLVRRPSTFAWIRSLGMDTFPGSFHDVRLDWTEGSRDLSWDRRVVAMDEKASTVTLDAPLTMALEARFGGATVSTYRWPGRLERIGVEHLTLESTVDPNQPADEEHAWFGVSLDAVEDAWVRGVTVRRFASSAVLVGPKARSVTVAECRSEAPVAEKGAWRRMAFFSSGELVLFRSCHAEGAWNAWAVGHAAAGPTVFQACTAAESLSAAGPAESWASGVLYDGVRNAGAPLRLARLPLSGWSAANSVVWNSEASEVTVDSPPGAPNLSVQDAAVPSLYAAQRARNETVPPSRAEVQLPNGSARRARTSSLARVEDRPRTASPNATTGAAGSTTPPGQAGTMRIAEGRLWVGEQILPRKSTRTGWWKGQMVPKRAAELGSSPTRWAPGRTGTGLTEDLEALLARWKSDGVGLVEAIPGLWYERRRDDHTTDTRADGAVAAPFFEMAWARSGRGTAADGLSRYDLTRFNPWYFGRLKSLAGLCSRDGLVLLHHFYNHHNLVESSAHWADFPWRPANCLQDTGFPEPPPYEEEGKRVRLATAFYDLSHPVRRDLHRRFIRHGLSVFAGEPNVIHVLAFQDAAPLAFHQFFLDTVAEWQAETGHRPRIALMTGKNVVDAILADPKREALVDLVDTRYWQYMADGSLFAPPAGGNKAYREYRTEAFGKDAVPASTPEQVARQLREYAERFPSKVVVCPQADDLGLRY